MLRNNAVVFFVLAKIATGVAFFLHRGGFSCTFSEKVQKEKTSYKRVSSFVCKEIYS